MFFCNNFAEKISCHMFRNAIPSIIADFPNIFNDAHTMGWGRWKSKTFISYQKSKTNQKNGSSQKFKKFYLTTFNCSFKLLACKQKRKRIIPNTPSATSSEDEEGDDSDSSISTHKANYKIPKIKKTDSPYEIAKLRIDFPNLSHHSDDIFRSLSLTELIRLDKKLESTSKSAKKLTEKMAKNLEKMKKFPKKIQEGEDNRSDKLHAARFIGGHACRHTDIWLQARQTIGLTGLEPISRYDSEALGISGHINSHIWYQLHNPGSKEVSIKMLSPQALKAARAATDKEVLSAKKDFEEVSEIAIAMSTLNHAVHCVHPWNFSTAALEFFLVSIAYGEKEVATKTTRISYLTDFIDEVLLHNAEAWDDGKPFLTHTELSNKWLTQMMMRTPKAGPSKQNNQGGSNQKNNNGNGNNPRPPPPPQQRQIRSEPPFHSKRFLPALQFQLLPKQSDKSCPATWDPKIMLKHACAHYNSADKKYCQKDHSFLDHKN
jgi:hypothetical protein